jgi:hypothetical protein
VCNPVTIVNGKGGRKIDLAKLEKTVERCRSLQWSSSGGCCHSVSLRSVVIGNWGGIIGNVL